MHVECIYGEYTVSTMNKINVKVIYSVADPEGDPRVPWIPPFRLNLACKIELKATYQRSNSLSQLALLACLYNLATNNH